MTSKEALEILRNNTIEAGNKIAKLKGIKNREIVKTVTANGETLIIYPEEELNIIEKDLEILESLKKVLSKVAYTPEFAYDKKDKNGFIPVNCEYKVTCGEEFDIILFKNLIDQLGFELVKK